MIEDATQYLVQCQAETDRMLLALRGYASKSGICLGRNWNCSAP